MGDVNKGTDLNNIDNTEWFIVEEADCVDNSLTALDDLFEESTNGSVVSNLLDDEPVDQGNSLALYNTQIADECDRAIGDLKRKYIGSPQKSIVDLSPRLAAVHISPQRVSKKRLFEDSGIVEDEASNSNELLQVEAEHGNRHNESHNTALLDILKCNNAKALFLGKFKDLFGVSFTDLTRQFKSDKTCCENWVLALYKVSDEIINSSKTILKQQCEYVQIIMYDIITLYLLQFRAAKSRDTINKMFTTVFDIHVLQILSDPPRSRSVAAALFFFTKRNSNACFYFGELPEWVAKHTLVNHQVAAAAETFELSQMIQWAYDNHLNEDHEIAYGYAQIADIDVNAAAFLKSNQQAKYVRDCAHMVRLYRRHEMRQMSMSHWIQKCCRECSTTGEWKIIASYLRYQNINVVAFLTALRSFFKCIPKKNCILLYGPPDTGKSYFGYSLVRFLRGKVISMMNRHSQFWLMPLQDGKIGFLDDCTYSAWQFMDINMRAALDGNDISLDSKHKAPVQLKLPPLLVTSNHDVMADQTLRYLHSRLTAFKFPNQMPLDEFGNPMYIINDETWKSFFIKLAVQLDLQFEEEDESGRPDRAFRCTAGPAPDSL
jgi:hypothetical protein